MIAGIIQARTASTRLPNKILLKACGKTMLELMIERVMRAKKLDKILIATTVNKKDDVIENFCNDNNLEYFRGSQENVLSRYKKAADQIGAGIIVRLSSDCPLIDPLVIDRVVTTYLEKDYDFVNNRYPNPSTYPDGTSVEVFSVQLLNETNSLAKKPSEREHVTFFMWMQPERYKVYRLDYVSDLSKYRLNLDYWEDYLLIKSVFEGLYPTNPSFTMEDVIGWLDKHPDVKKLNAHIKLNLGWQKSFEKDKEMGFD